MATLGLSAAEQDAMKAFERDVVEPSMTQLVILDFWAEWCGPCKQLGPVLDKIAQNYAAKGVKLVKIDVDKEKMIAAQFRVQSIPTVYALFQGQLVADLTQYRTEAQFTRALDEILKQLPIEATGAEPTQDLAPLLEMGEEVLAGGDGARAAAIFSQIAEMAPDNADAAAGLARALVLTGDLDGAQAALAALTPEQAKLVPVARAQAALALAREAQPIDDLGPLHARIAADADDHEARYELAGALMASGDRDGAADMLLESIARDRGWNDGAARTRLLTLFDAVGLMDPWVGAQRRRLSAVLFT